MLKDLSNILKASRLILTAIILMQVSCYFSQTRIVKPVKKQKAKSTNLGLGGSFTRSVLYLNRNVKENNDANGYMFTLLYGGNKLARLSLEYTHYKTIDIRPTWYNIKASCIEANVHFLARFSKSRAVFYPIFGLSYNLFSGYFTGRNDFLNLRDKYEINQIVSTNWLGLNVGTGYEYYFRPLSLFVDYKMRVGFADGTDLNIMDVCFSFGARINLKVPTFYKIFKGPRGRYFLDPTEVK